jgi:asparagine synthase (glutamine-hydrolysing)
VARPWLPPDILHGTKRGLSVPVGGWIAGALAPEVDRLLAPDRIAAQGLLRAEAVARLVTEHRNGAADHGRALWTLLTLEDWIDHWGPETSG